MTTKRLLILQIILLIGLSSVFLVPSSPKIQPSGVKLELPEILGIWQGESLPITEKELAVLAKDTEFARRLYQNPFGDQIFVSIVLSGQDLDNSIHRPERCLPAQGWTIADSRALSIPLSSGQRLKVMRLHDVRDATTTDGKVFKRYNLNYYWFIGADDLTASHFERTFIDIRDRIFRGTNQRWAFVTVAADITKGLTRFGRSDDEVDRMLQEFITQLFPQIVDQRVKG